MKKLTIKQVAAICHNANTLYCESIGDHSQTDWSTAPEWQKHSVIDGVEFHVNRMKTGHLTKPESSHHNWTELKHKEGWTYGKVKNEKLKQHPGLVPYSKLSPEQKAKDYLFRNIVLAFYNSKMIASE